MYRPVLCKGTFRYNKQYSRVVEYMMMYIGCTLVPGTGGPVDAVGTAGGTTTGNRASTVSQLVGKRQTELLRGSGPSPDPWAVGSTAGVAPQAPSRRFTTASRSFAGRHRRLSPQPCASERLEANASAWTSSRTTACRNSRQSKSDQAPCLQQPPCSTFRLRQQMQIARNWSRACRG